MFKNNDCYYFPDVDFHKMQNPEAKNEGTYYL